MIYVVFILLVLLALSLSFNYLQHQWLLDERERLYESEEWIDPIALEEDDG